MGPWGQEIDQPMIVRWRVRRNFFLALPAVVAHRPHRGFEVGRRLLLDLVREVVNFEPVQPESGQQTK